MTETVRRKISSSPAARWTVLLLVSFTMLTGYIISDVMSPLKPMLEESLGWDSAEYGILMFGYGFFNVFLFMLIFAGMILDKMGPRFTGVLAVIIMICGTLLKYWAINTDFAGQVLNILGFWQVKAQVFYAMLGFAIFGVGIEMIGITASKIVVKWFRGHSLALAMGLNVAAGRIGTGIALLGALPYAEKMGNPSSPLLLCLIMLCIGLLSFLVFSMMDRKADKERELDSAAVADTASEEDKFHMRDIFSIIKIRGFWYITILCLLFYSAVFPFLKYATDLMIQKFDVSTSWAGAIPALIPFGNILLTPLFGSIYDKKGKGATIMMIGALLLVLVHVLFSIPAFSSPVLAIALMLILGAGFSLVPSAMWPSVPKIIPYHKLGTAYSVIFWIQNIGLSCVPLLIGWVLSQYCVIGTTISEKGNEVFVYDYTLPMMIFASFGVLSVLFAYLLKKEDARKQYGLEKPNIQE